MKKELRQYATCVKALQKHGLTRRQIAALIGIDEAVVSRRMAGKQEPTREALIAVNALLETFDAVKAEKRPGLDMREGGWMYNRTVNAIDVHELGRVA